MILEDFQIGILKRLKSDAYFTQSEAIELRAEVRPDTRKTVQDAMTGRGIIGIVGLPKDGERAAHDAFVFRCVVEFFENPKKNPQGENDRTGMRCLAKAMGLLHDYTIPFSNASGERVDPFSKLRITGFGCDEINGVPVFQLRIESKIYIDVLTAVLANENGFVLTNELGQSLSVSPTNS